MQPFDALTIKVILQEAKPFLVSRKVDRVLQVARDEIVLTLRSRTGISHFLLSAHASFGRLCLVNMLPQSKRNNPPNFCMLMRKHLSGATLIAVEQLPGERIVDIFFSCLDEVGSPSQKVLTAEIMGRHSNLIFWDKSSGQILGASHVVTKDMSRQREVMPGLKYIRPPVQEKPNIFKLTAEQFDSLAGQHLEDGDAAGLSLEQWLMSTFTGLGRHLAEELVACAAGAGTTEPEPAGVSAGQPGHEKLWRKISALQGEMQPKPAMRQDLTRYSVLSLWPDCQDETQWKTFPSVNDMVEEYFRHHESKERFEQLRDRLHAELRQEIDKLKGRLDAASKYVGASGEKADYKKFGDLILAHITEIRSGQTELVCDDLYSPNGSQVSIPLNPNMTASQNAQHYYRLFAKMRTREAAAGQSRTEAGARLALVQQRLLSLGAATTVDELEKLKEVISPARPAQEAPRAQQAMKKKPKQRLLSMTSSDGWTIYMGRNRQENDELMSHVAQPHDIWMHILGSGGSHVLIKVPSTKQDPPMRTLQEAAQAAARLSKAAVGGKVHVVYTQCRYVRKIAKNKPGVVRYENEKTLEVDTARPMPEMLKRLFASRM